MNKKIFMALVGAVFFANSTFANAGGAGFIFGGAICSGIGGGNGRIAAILFCGSIGSDIGDSMTYNAYYPYSYQFGPLAPSLPAYYYDGSASSVTYRHYEVLPPPTYLYYVPPVDVPAYDEIEVARAHGRAVRAAREKQEAINRAYKCGDDGTC